MSNWDRIVATHGGIVWQNAYRLLGNHADAADCFQDAFTAALEVSRRQKVRNWPGLLGKLATCKALDMLRSRFRRNVWVGEQADWAALATDAPGPVEQLENAELASQLRRAIAQLPDGQSEVFCLHYLSDLKYRQIARLLGMKTSTVGVTLHRARARLRELLSPEAAPSQMKDAEVSE